MQILARATEKDFKRSRVTDGKLSNGRTSSSCFLTGEKGKEEVVKTDQRRMLNAIRKTPVLTKRRFDTQNLKGSEPMQIVRYGKNEKYTNHFDNKAGSFRRVSTFMCSLDHRPMRRRMHKLSKRSRCSTNHRSVNMECSNRLRRRIRHSLHHVNNKMVS